MLENSKKNIQLIPSKYDLLILKVLNQSEAPESMLLTVDELRDISEFLNELPLLNRPK